MRNRDDSKIDSIFKATLTLVKDRGLAGITMCDISKEAAIGTGTLYIYFKNKEELIKALFQQCRDQSARHYFKDLDASHSFEERLKRLFINVIEYKLRSFEVAAFMEQSYHSPFVCMADIKKKQRAMAPLYDLIKEGIETKKLKAMDIDLLISYIFGVINEMVKKAYFSNKKLNHEAILSIYQMVWDGVRFA